MRIQKSTYKKVRKNPKNSLLLPLFVCFTPPLLKQLIEIKKVMPAVLILNFCTCEIVEYILCKSTSLCF
jgi:hypothetical protein